MTETGKRFAPFRGQNGPGNDWIHGRVIMDLPAIPAQELLPQNA